MAGVSQSPQAPRHRAAAAETLAAVGGYAVLFAFGLFQGLTGSLQFSRGVGPVPVAAIAFALAIGVTCALCGRGMRSAWGAAAPAAGWVIASFALALPEASGTVVITNTAGGQVYLYGGALCAAIGVGAGLSRRLPRSGRAPSPGPLR